jgi:hypothetical protein
MSTAASTSIIVDENPATPAPAPSRIAMTMNTASPAVLGESRSTSSAANVRLAPLPASSVQDIAAKPIQSVAAAIVPISSIPIEEEEESEDSPAAAPAKRAPSPSPAAVNDSVDISDLSNVVAPVDATGPVLFLDGSVAAAVSVMDATHSNNSLIDLHEFLSCDASATLLSDVAARVEACGADAIADQIAVYTQSISGDASGSSNSSMIPTRTQLAHLHYERAKLFEKAGDQLAADKDMQLSQHYTSSAQRDSTFFAPPPMQMQHTSIMA